MDRSRWGLELRAVGENPQAADVTGIKVGVRRRQALLWCGALAVSRGRLPRGRRGRIVQPET
ncbi:ABC transporter permease subunit [Streptomyces yanii]|uniref:ABC transporter permease subunit n=1 Tax=Streptomyces yanii TaxID=78510 RepID=UPI003CD06D49